MPHPDWFAWNGSDETISVPSPPSFFVARGIEQEELHGRARRDPGDIYEMRRVGRFDTAFEPGDPDDVQNRSGQGVVAVKDRR